MPSGRPKAKARPDASSQSDELAELQPDPEEPMLTKEGASFDPATGDLGKSEYVALANKFQTDGTVKLPDMTRKGVRPGETVPTGLRSWEDKRGKGWVTSHPSEVAGKGTAKRAKWFSVVVFGSWRYAFLLARLQLLVWKDRSSSGASSTRAVPSGKCRPAPAASSRSSRDSRSESSGQKPEAKAKDTKQASADADAKPSRQQKEGVIRTRGSSLQAQSTASPSSPSLGRSSPSSTSVESSPSSGRSSTTSCSSNSDDLTETSTDSDVKSGHNQTLKRPRGRPRKRVQPEHGAEPPVEGGGQGKRAKVQQETATDTVRYITLPPHVKPLDYAALARQKMEAMEDLALGHIEQTAANPFNRKQTEPPISSGYIDELDREKKQQHPAAREVLSPFVTSASTLAPRSPSAPRSPFAPSASSSAPRSPFAASSSSSAPFPASDSRSAAERKETAAMLRQLEHMRKLLEQRDSNKTQAQQAEPQQALAAGGWVRVQGLRDNAHLNGHVGKLMDYLASVQRWQVAVVGVPDNLCNIKPANLKAITVDEAKAERRTKQAQPEESVQDIW